jgi:S1-C subfamily serine protease
MIALIERFAADKPDFPKLSAAILNLIPKIMKEKPSASALQILEEAYRRAKLGAYTSGTGFFVAPHNIVTNAHVVEGCRDITVAHASRSERGRLIAADKANDLALIDVPGLETTSIPTLRDDIRVGEQVATYGYPLSNLLPSSGNFTLGHVSAIAGIGDDSRFVQISTPIQPGNSGGPLMDKAGNVVGIIVAKLNASAFFSQFRDLPQNVNFAIKTSVLRAFLSSRNVSTQTKAPNSDRQESEALAAIGQRVAVFIVCKG